MNIIKTKNKIIIAITILFSVLKAAGMTLVALILQQIIDIAMNPNMEQLKRLLIGSIIYFIVLGLISYIYGLCSKILIRNITHEMRENVFHGVFNRDYEHFLSMNVSDYLSIFLNDTKIIEENYILPILTLIQNLATFIITLVILIFLSPIITVTLFVLIIILLLVPALFSKSLENKQNKFSNQFSFFTNKIKDLLSGYEIIHSFQMNEYVTKKFKKENKDLAECKYLLDKLFVLSESISELLSILVIFVIVFMSAYLIIIGEIKMGTMIALVQLSSGFIQPIVMIISNIAKIKSVDPILEKLKEISTCKSDFKGSELPTFNRGIEVKNLSFSYNEEKMILKDINFSFEKNKKYALIGASGCGKTTLVKLILGYYASFSGNIYYDNTDIKQLDIKEIYRIISMIHQNVYMFDSDIKQNICLQKEFSNSQIDMVLKQSGADQFVYNTKDGLSTLVGENGNNLSGGQRQRIAVARALIQKTQMLILDEGTSAIDMKTGYEIEKKLLDIPELTIISITHKLEQELLKAYDCIIYMDNGEIVEYGHFDELFNKKGKFFDFFTWNKEIDKI